MVFAESSRYPLRFLTRQMTDRRFRSFAQFRAVVLWPYDMDLVSFYEFYAMNIPMFMPSELSKYIFHQHHLDYDGRFPQSTDVGSDSLWKPSWGTPFNETSLEVLRHLAVFSDYFRYPAVQHFAGLGDFLVRLLESDFSAIVEEMAAFNQELIVEGLAAWRSILSQVGTRNVPDG